MRIGKDQKSNHIYRCKLCRSIDIKLRKKANIRFSPNSDDFRITDNRYGLMWSIYQCKNCGFLQCLDAPDTKNYYKTLKDPDYEAGRQERLLQARAILRKIMKVNGGKSRGLRLLDIGAGSGILLEAASELGFEAEGIEPSDWLRATAKEHGCKIIADVIPHREVSGPYDIITLVDVVEHVAEPMDIMQNAVKLIQPGGSIVIITPDVKSFAARIMGWKWWHYRIAHVGYFTKSTIEFVCSQIGLKIISVSRPNWVFTVAYLRERLLNYMPSFLIPAEKSWMHKVNVSVNLFDSLMFIAIRS